ncbi:hypothetical protein JXD20_01050, partial [Candidatus Peregrinibacteria bacterium]|nr:hypothetical protein [Candidatus Peregrinibacteria bacterium]
MKKESLITISLLASAILAGCSSGTGNGTTDDLKEIGKAMEAGKAMTCEVVVVDENLPATDMTYYIDGDN